MNFYNLQLDDYRYHLKGFNANPNQESEIRMSFDPRKLLEAAGVFYYTDDDVGPKELNMNDTFCWGEAFGEEVPEGCFPEVADLFWRYGSAGLVYWVSERNKLRSEFEDINRQIDFVKHEEELRKREPTTTNAPT